MRLSRLIMVGAAAFGLLGLGFTAPASAATTVPALHAHPDTSPMPCTYMLGGNVCYQIVNNSHPSDHEFVDYWWGTNSGPDTISWTLTAPSGFWASGQVAPHGDWYSFWQKDALKGSWCVTYTYPNQVPQKLCESVK